MWQRRQSTQQKWGSPVAQQLGPAGVGVWVSLAQGLQKPFHVNEKPTEASLTLLCLARD